MRWSAPRAGVTKRAAYGLTNFAASHSLCMTSVEVKKISIIFAKNLLKFFYKVSEFIRSIIVRLKRRTKQAAGGSRSDALARLFARLLLWEHSLELFQILVTASSADTYDSCCKKRCYDNISFLYGV